MLVAINIHPANAASKKKEICPSPVSVSCFKKNFDALYQNDVNVCTAAYSKHQEKALSCSDIKATSEYLGLAPIIENNAEISEDFGEVLENFIVDKPVCFLDAASLLDDHSLKVLIKRYAKEPTFQDESKIKRTLQKHRKNQKYAKIMSFYFSK